MAKFLFAVDYDEHEKMSVVYVSEKVVFEKESGLQYDFNDETYDEIANALWKYKIVEMMEGMYSTDKHTPEQIIDSLNKEPLFEYSPALAKIIQKEREE